ncbi:MAG: DUF3090 family protein [Chloroflexota bacterium]
MDSQQLSLGVVSSLIAETFGDPGQRTFRLRAEARAGTVSLWLEKEQLRMVGGAVEEVLRRVAEPRGNDPASDSEGGFSGDLEVRVGALAVGYDKVRLGFTIEATEFTSPFDLESIELIARRRDFERLAEQIGEIVAAGRPRCPLCGTPLEGEPHFCPPSNGHAHTSS